MLPSGLHSYVNFLFLKISNKQRKKIIAILTAISKKAFPIIISFSAPFTHPLYSNFTFNSIF